MQATQGQKLTALQLVAILKEVESPGKRPQPKDQTNRVKLFSVKVNVCPCFLKMDFKNLLDSKKRTSLQSLDMVHSDFESHQGAMLGSHFSLGKQPVILLSILKTCAIVFSTQYNLFFFFFKTLFQNVSYDTKIKKKEARIIQYIMIGRILSFHFYQVTEKIFNKTN